MEDLWSANNLEYYLWFTKPKKKTKHAWNICALIQTKYMIMENVINASHRNSTKVLFVGNSLLYKEKVYTNGTWM